MNVSSGSVSTAGVPVHIIKQGAHPVDSRLRDVDQTANPNVRAGQERGQYSVSNGTAGPSCREIDQAADQGRADERGGNVGSLRNVWVVVALQRRRRHVYAPRGRHRLDHLIVDAMRRAAEGAGFPVGGPL